MKIFEPIGDNAGYNVIEACNDQILPVSDLTGDNQKLVILNDFACDNGTPGERGPQGFPGDKGDRGDTSALRPKGDAGLALNVSSNVDMKNYSIENMANPINVCDAANKKYVDAISNDILTGIDTFRGNINMNNHKIVNLATPTNNADATNKTYVDTLVNTSVKLDGSNTLTGSLNVGNNKIINVPALTTGTDATNKTYVDKHEHNG